MIERIGILSDDLWAMRDEIAHLTGASPVRLGLLLPARCDAILGWNGPRGLMAGRVGTLLKLPVHRISVGPLRSVRPIPRETPLALRVTPSVRPGVETAPPPLGAAEGFAQWRHLRLSWRNDGRDRLPATLANAPFVLAIVARGAANDTLIHQAAADHPGRRIALVADSREPAGLADRIAARHPGTIEVKGTNPHALFDAAACIYAPAGSELGRDARLAGCRVLGDVPDTTEADTASLFAGSFLGDLAYFDAWTRKPSDFAHVADQLAWLRERYLENDRPTICIGVSRWKQRPVTAFLDGPDGEPRFATSVATAIEQAKTVGGRVVTWETRMPSGLTEACAEAGVPLERMEDGFLRSVGLGAAFRPGASAILDRRGIYYDPRRESDLEHILAATSFSPELIERAGALQQRIVALRLSKYNVGRAAALDDLPAGRRIVLVPGQVEDDASVMFGSPQVRGNLALLRAARRHNPDAFLVFKPHPDVEAGLRKGRIAEKDALALADRVVSDISIADLLDRVDQVETMTSLTGFEALLRGKTVAVHGRPFYAGWGLTLDRDPPERRTRRLTLDELVAGALILYPLYVDPVTGLRCPPEILVDRLAAARDVAAAAPAFPARARAVYVRARYALLGPLALALRRARGAVRSAPSQSDSQH
jgi:capsular polysaccharide export protein